MGGVDELVAVLVVCVAPEGLDDIADSGTHRMPGDEPGANLIVGAEKLHLHANLAVVALLGLLDLLQILVKLLLGRERSAVDALEHLVLLVPTEVGTRNAGQLDCADLGGVLDVGAAAEVDEVAAGVQRDGLALGDVLQTRKLVGLPLGFEDGLRLLAGDLRTHEGNLLADHLAHSSLDLLQVTRLEPVLHVEVVVEAIRSRRTDVEFDVRPEFCHDGRHDVGRGVADGAKFQIAVRHCRCCCAYVFGEVSSCVV